MKNNVYFTNFAKTKTSNAFKRYFSDVKNCPEKSAKSGILLICSPWKLCTGVSIGLGARLLLYNGPTYCKASQNGRTIQRRPNLNQDTAKFDWWRLLEYLKPHKSLLAAAIAVSKP